MPLGKNTPLQDTLIKRTTDKTSKTNKGSNTRSTRKVYIPGRPSGDPSSDTFGTRKMTFFIKEDLLKRLYNLAYWDRHSVTAAFNKALEDGLKGKNTKNKV